MSSGADRKPRRILLLPIGSSGDVNPFLWIGRTLRARGHEVSVIANPVFGDTIRALGLRHVPFGDESEYRELLDHPDVWHPLKGPPLVLRYAGEITSRYFEAVAREVGGDRPLVLAPATAFGARLAREKFGFPLISVHLQPCIFLTVGDTALFGSRLGWLQKLPPFLKRSFFSAIRARIGYEVNPGVRRACRLAGVAAPRHPFRDWWQSPDGGVCLWPAWFGAPQPEWGAHVACAGFPLYDLADQIALPPELEAFLAAGAPPILFTPGTAMAQGHRFFEIARDACQQAGRRAIFATKFPETLPANLPPEIFHAHYVPFSALLPRCAAIVHHGGIGTTSQALAAGIPQLIRPFSHDQPDNADRIRRLGVGDWIWPRNFTAHHLANALRELDEPARRERCAAISEKLRAADPATRLLEILGPHLAHAA